MSKKRKTGFVLLNIQASAFAGIAIIMLVQLFDFLLSGVNFNEEIIILIILIISIVEIAIFVAVIVLTIVAKSKIWAIKTLFIIYCLFSFWSILGIIGVTLVLSDEKSAKEEQTTTNELPEKNEEQESGKIVVPQYIQPKMSKKGKKVIMIILAVVYSLLLVFGVLLASIPSLSNLLTKIELCEPSGARAYAITIGVMWCALVPSFGYYFVTISPLEISKKNKTIIGSISLVLSVIMTVVFFIIINCVTVDGVIPIKQCFETNDSWFIPFTMVGANVGLIICHALTFFRIAPEKIKNAKPGKCGDGLLEVIKNIFATLLYGILSLLKAILTFKEKQPDIFILVSSILLTWFAFFTAFFVAIILIALLVGVVVMMLAGVVGMSYTPTSTGSFAITENGFKKTLTEVPPYANKSGYTNTYQDEFGNYYVSSDGGKTVEKY